MNRSDLTVVMYHYVRDIGKSRYPGIKGLEYSQFKFQIEYFLKKYTIVKMEDVVAAYAGKKCLPQNALLLTFDDGYRDHYDYVFPLLMEKGIQGTFFVPTEVLKLNKVLDVNKIHFILSVVEDNDQLFEDLKKKFKEMASSENLLPYKLLPFDEYVEKIDVGSRFDLPTIITIKRLLQTVLPDKVRMNIVDHLYKKYIEIPEEIFARELYASEDQVKCMAKAGMHIGLHGHSHCWLDSIPKTRQEQEVDDSIAYFQKIGVIQENWTISFPYGGYDETLLNIICKKGCSAAFTTEAKAAQVSFKNRFQIPRLDTNDFPKKG